MLSQFYLKYTLFKSKLQVYSASYTQTGLLKILHKSLPCLRNQNTLKLYSQKHSGGWGDAQLSFQFSSVAQSCSNSLEPPWTAALQASLSITNSQSLLKLMSIGQWCHPTISSSGILFSFHLQSFPASGSFQTRQFFTSGGQNIGVSGSAPVLSIVKTDFL